MDEARLVPIRSGPIHQVAERVAIEHGQWLILKYGPQSGLHIVTGQMSLAGQNLAPADATQPAQDKCCQ